MEQKSSRWDNRAIESEDLKLLKQPRTAFHHGSDALLVTSPFIDVREPCITELVRCTRVAGLKEQRDKAIQDIASIPPPSNLVVLDQQSKESMASFDRLIMYCQTQLVSG